MKHKIIQAKVDDGDEGTITAVFSTLNVIDSDGDVTLPGAFQDGQKVRLSAWNHQSWQTALPVGSGVINEVGEQAIFTGKFFLNTVAGRDTYETIKALDDLTEFSYGFDILEAEPGVMDGEDVQFLKGLNVHEVSPVIKGAGVGTRTLAIKSDKPPPQPTPPDPKVIQIAARLQRDRLTTHEE